jgi:hypothetical protein
MKRFVKNMLYTLLLCAIVCASFSCGHDDLDILTNYGYSVETLPLPKKLKVGEVAEIRCQIIRNGYYNGTKYSLRYFQFDGKGELWMEGGKPFLPNDLYDLPKETFRLYFRSLSEDQHTIEVVFLDNFNNKFVLPLSFGNEKADE